MQTFLPYPCYKQSARVLDNKRLGKQRVEVLQLLNALFNKTKWSNHPAAKMWKGYELSLCSYGLAVCSEWIRRGFKDTCRIKIQEIKNEMKDSLLITPHWLYGKIHISHRSNLLRKNKEWYGRFGWSEPDNIPYYWPTNEKD